MEDVSSRTNENVAGENEIMCSFDLNFLATPIMKIKASAVLYCTIEEIIVEFLYASHEKLKFWTKCLAG